MAAVTENDLTDLRDLTILVTGATGGIGRELSHRLGAAGAHVVLHGRKPEALAALAREVDAAGAASVVTHVADLASLTEVAGLADVIAKSGKLDVLIANAGVGFGSDRTKREITHDGFEGRFAVNYLAPFVLIERLAARDLPTRAVVDVASAGQAPVVLEDLMSERDYDGWLAYRRSKLALISDAFDRASRRPDVASVALHPGTFLDTAMVREAGIAPQGTASSGAEAVLAVLLRAIAGTTGKYFDVRTEKHADPQAHDAAARMELRKRTLALVAPFLR